MNKLVIVMRKDLNMRKGKMCAQAGHAVQKAIFSTLDTEATKEYMNSRWFKICVGVDSLEELKNVLNHAKESEIPCGMITDAGFTEFNGIETETCIYVGPYDSDIINKVTGELKLL